ncbi:di-heme-cytochrome C peroxidase [Phenylobacterium sp.]|jgi:hypothetical protein|uniref:di-heme-cytochrome C peroxidase n=1 Tax=Phenylobacterium sp. TaxID=1871053 RepID=UPI002F3ED21E
MSSRFFRVVGVIALAGMLAGVAGAQVIPDLDQGWGPAERQDWYGLSQGSRLIPLAFLKAMEQPAPAGPSPTVHPGRFLDDGYIAHFRYLPAAAAGERLPAGFILDTTPPERLTRTNLQWKVGQGRSEPWVGMNCSACHTAQLDYSARGTRQLVSLRIEGGPTLADFQGFIEALTLAVNQTLAPPAAEPDRFDRFAQAVLGADNSNSNRRLLKAALQAVAKRQNETAQANALPAGYHYGYGRLDAFGNIYNKVRIAASPKPEPMAANAPVSYPFLWNVPQHDRVQWNGIAPNRPAPLLPLARNTGEVIGVFADIELASPGFAGLPPGYKSSVNVDNLKRLEQALWTLKPPRWPDELFGKPDELFGKPPEQVLTPGETLVETGRKRYAEHCQSCHELLPGGRDDLSSRITAQMFQFASQDPTRPPPGTDIWMACNAVTRTADSGVLKGTNYAAFKWLPGRANVSDMLLVSVVGSILGGGQDMLQALNEDLLGASHDVFGTTFLAPKPFSFAAFFSGSAATGPTAADEARREKYCRETPNELLGYKARPLYGVWATAPFLHNGSTPTLYDLMLPPAERPKRFYTGSREFDPEKVGLVTAQGPDDILPFDTVDGGNNPIPGNSNAGHDYGNAGLTPADRWAIIAFIKAGLPAMPPR